MFASTPNMVDICGYAQFKTSSSELFDGTQRLQQLLLRNINLQCRLYHALSDCDVK